MGGDAGAAGRGGGEAETTATAITVLQHTPTPFLLKNGTYRTEKNAVPNPGNLLTIAHFL